MTSISIHQNLVNPPAQELNLAPLPEQLQVSRDVCVKVWHRKQRVGFLCTKLHQIYHVVAAWLNMITLRLNRSFQCSFRCHIVIAILFNSLAASTARSISRKVFFLHKLVRRRPWRPAMRCKRNLEMTWRCVASFGRFGSPIFCKHWFWTGRISRALTFERVNRSTKMSS